MRSALEVAEIFRRHGDAYRQAQAGHLGLTERRVMSAIELCRTAALGGHVEHCADCGLIRVAYNSCRNRHCPKCQSLARAEWLAERQAELLPVPYFHVVFTLPAAVAEIAFQNKATVYALLFRAAAETLGTIAADPRHLGAEIGVIAVLHTWGQTLHHHPHLHCVVPGGGLSLDGPRWIACRPGFFLPVRVLSRLFRRLFLEQLQAAFEAGKLGFFGDLASLAKQASFEQRLGGAAPGRMGRLRQATLRQFRTGPRLSRPLHSSRRHRQQSAHESRPGTGQLPLARLPASQQSQGHDPRRR
jgi:Transposase zinc-binding domain/Putative transposase